MESEEETEYMEIEKINSNEEITNNIEINFNNETNKNEKSENDNKVSTPPSLHKHKKPAFFKEIDEIQNNYNFEKTLGAGTFSTVYLTHKKFDHSQKFAFKHVLPTSHPMRTLNELRLLKKFGGKESIIELLGCMRHLDNVIIIMPYFPHDRFKDYVGKLSFFEITLYVKSLLSSLSLLHSFGIIHRDIKPSNFLFNRKLQKFALIDFGLSHKVGEPTNFNNIENNKNNKNNKNNNKKTCKCFGRPQVCKICLSRPPQNAPRAGTHGFRAPEVLMRCEDQTTALDVWSSGIIFLSLLCLHHPTFTASNDLSLLLQLVSIFGSSHFVRAAHSMGKKVICVDKKAIGLRSFVINMRKFNFNNNNNDNNENNNNDNNNNNNDNFQDNYSNNKNNISFVPEELLLLLEKMLELRSSKRITAEDGVKEIIKWINKIKEYS